MVSRGCVTQDKEQVALYYVMHPTVFSPVVTMYPAGSQCPRSNLRKRSAALEKQVAALEKNRLLLLFLEKPGCLLENQVAISSEKQENQVAISSL